MTASIVRLRSNGDGSAKHPGQCPHVLNSALQILLHGLKQMFVVVLNKKNQKHVKTVDDQQLYVNEDEQLKNMIEFTRLCR